MHKDEHQLLKMVNIRTLKVVQGKMDHFLKNQESKHLPSDKGHLEEQSLRVYNQTWKSVKDVQKKDQRTLLKIH